MKNQTAQKIIRALIFAAGAGVFLSGTLAWAAPEVGLSGDQSRAFLTADNDGRYQFVNVPLRRNAVNRFTVTARDGNITQSREVLITQISLDSVVVSKIKAQPLSVQEIEKLVSDGVIDIKDPSNFNVSKFEIVLTIGRREVSIDIPIVRGVEEPMGSEEIAPQSDPGDGRNSNPQPPEIVVFEVQPPGPPGEPPPPPIPGVLIIEGRIKTLKEFYSVRLLLMNTSGIFTLHDVAAQIEFPDGGLSPTLPADGIVQFGDILPGDGEVPGQKEREFIIRGDEIGIRAVKVNFGGTLIGPGIPDDEPIPFNGSAETTVEVKGPPDFRVQVIHPPSVVAGIPYELIVDIANVGQTPALYTSFELDVGADGRLVECTFEEGMPNPVCVPLEGYAIRNIGHLLPGERTRQSFMIEPLVSGDVSSCMGISDQNIDLQVFVGAIGCITGKRPPALANPDGIPTVSVLPAPNMFGLGVDTPVTAFFNEKMNTSTITTGEGGSFNVFNDAGERVPGQLRFAELFDDHTVAIWQPTNGPLAGNTTFTVNLAKTVSDLQGFSLTNDWVSEFTTTDPNNDITPPTLSLSVEPPVDPNHVIPGQLIELNAYAADQGSGVNRIELFIRDEDVPDSVFELVDQKTIFPTSTGPFIFSIDSSKLAPGHTYQLKGAAYDHGGNRQESTLAVILASSAAGPVIELPPDPVDDVLQGISVTVMPDSLSQGVKRVDYYLDGDSNPFSTVTLSPFSVTVPTLSLNLGTHTIRAVATDGLGQTGEDVFSFDLAENKNEPIVNFGGAVDGTLYLTGASVPVKGYASDPLGIETVAFYLNQPAGTPISTTTEPFVIPTENLPVGVHEVFFKATNRLGISNDLNDPASVLTFEIVAPPPPAPPPPAPVITGLTHAIQGVATVSGTAEPGSSLEILNVNQGTAASFTIGASGAFQLPVDAETGHLIRLTVLKLSVSPSPSAPAEAVVPAPPVLNSISVTPANASFSAFNQFQDLAVKALYEGGAEITVTAQASYSSSNAAVASVNASGRVVPIANGSAVITVSFDGKQAQMPVTVNVLTLESISLSPQNVVLYGLSKTQGLTLTGHYSDGSTASIGPGQAVFASSHIGIATVNSSGTVTSIAVGNAVVTASVSGLPPAQASVQVQPLAVSGISVSPNAILFTGENETRQLDVTVNYNDGSTGTPVEPVDYDSSAPSVASVDGNGLVTAAANGDATITVQYQGKTATVTVVTDIPAANVPPPELTGMDRYFAGEGDAFSIFGKNFAAVPANNIVRINSLQVPVQSARQDELTLVVPKGAVSGPLTVEVGGKTSNSLQFYVYGRTAVSVQITPPVDIAAASGAKLALPGPLVDFRTGDKVYLSSAPDILAPLSYTGQLRARLNGGAFFDIGPSGQVIELTGSFSPGEHNLELDLGEAAGKHKTAAIYLVAGPNGTGAIAGARSIMANGQSRAQPVTFINLTDHAGNPYPDGAKVVVTAGSYCFRSRPHNFCIGSHGGSILNGEGDSPDGYGLKVFTVHNQRIDVLYDPGTAPPLETAQGGTANIQVLPANASGNRTSDMVLDVASVSLTVFQTVGTSRSQTSAVADGLEKIVTVTFSGARDSAGQPVPDGTPFLVTVEAHCFRDPAFNNCIGSAGGSILSGVASADGYGLRRHILSGGKAEVQYSPGGTLLEYPLTAMANLQFLPSRPDGSRIGSRAFQITPIQLSSAQAMTISAPASVFADTGDNRVLLTLSDIKDSLGNPVPDGTKVVVTAEAQCFRHPATNACIPSAGGVIVSGIPSPDGYGLKVHEIHGGQTQVTYSAQGVGLQSRQTAVVTVQIMPSNPNGNRIGSRAIAIREITATGYQAAAASASPSAVVADGNSKSVTITLTNIRDTAGNVVPDGAKIVATPEAQCFREPVTLACIGSSGGRITSGTPSPDGYGLKVHTVIGGQVQMTYDPDTVLLAYPDTGVANIQVMPSTPAGNRIQSIAFAIIPVSLSSLQQADVSVSPGSLLADQSSANVAAITLSNIKDGAGSSVPNGTKLVATASAVCFRDPATNACVGSAGGQITSGTPSPDGYDLKVHTVQSGTVQMTYTPAPVGLESRQASLANVQILPAQPGGSRVGNRAFVLAPVTLAGYQSAVVSGPGQLAPNAVGTYIVSDIRDTSGNLVPDGSKIAVTASAVCFRNPDTNDCVGSAGGEITNGVGSSDGYGLRVFTVASGQISVEFKAPPASGTSVLQLLPANPSGNRLGNRCFTLKAVAVSS